MSSNGFSFGNFTRNFFTRKNKCFNYIATVFELSLETIIYLLVTMGLSAMLLSLVSMCWYTYRDTHVGLVFVKKLGNNYGFLTEIIQQDFVQVSFQLTLSAFVLCIIICSVCQFLYIGRFFQGVNGWLGKFMYWGIPFTFIVSAYFYRRPIYPVDGWSAAYILYFAPVLCLYGLCFKITDKLLPEIGTVIRAVFRAIFFIIDYVRSDDDVTPVPVPKREGHDAPRSEAPLSDTSLSNNSLQAKPVASMKVNTTN